MTKKKNAKESSRDAKRSRFQGEEEKSTKSKKWMLISVIGIVVVAGATVGAVLMLGGGRADETPLSTTTSSTSSATTSISYTAATNGHEPYPLVEADASGTVEFLLTTFDDYAAHYYTFVHNDESIEFFILKSEDGVVRAAFNACDVCFGALRGYSQNGQIMVCNNCGRQFPADRINIVKGGCNPSPLERAVEGNYLVIDEADIIEGGTYF